jgi:Carboxypeptidase regulatory-like domain/TonB dependent receptor
MSLRFTSSLWVRVRKAAEVLGVTLGVLLICLPLFSQTNFGRILGIVTDQSGGVIPDATVTIVDTQRGVARTLTTNEVGEYNAPTLIPGTYTVHVEAKGFKVLDRQNIVIEVGKEVRVDLTPELGDQTQTVTVTGQMPLVDTTTPTLGGILSNAEINDLPLNGRNYQNLMSLRPGVMIQPGGSPWTQSTNNIRPDETAWMVDGVINANFWDARPVANMSSPITDGATILPIDAIQEFNLMENPKAEYGWKPGAVVNVGIRSGTNTFHGSAYAFGRDVSWDARNVFNPAPKPILPTELEQFGGVVGGPVKKDKLFFFAGYEGLRSHIGNAITVSIPETASQATPAKPAGDPENSLVDAINALQAAGVTPSSVSMKLVGCTLAPVTCTGGLFSGASPNTTIYTSTFPNTNVSDNGIAKIDYRINSRHMINGMLLTGDYTGDGEDSPFVNRLFTDTVLIRTWTTSAHWIWTPTSRLVNEARFGYNRVNFSFFGNDSNILADGSGLTGGKGFPVNTGVRSPGGLPNIDIGGFMELGTNSGRPASNAPNPYSDYQDNVSYLRGKHALKFGGEFAHIEADDVSQRRARGVIGFNGNKIPGLTDCGGQSCPLEDFLAGIPQNGSILTGDGVRKMTWRSSAGFVQDDWRIKPKLMLNLGLRYEYKSPLKEVNGLWGSFDPNSPTGLVQQGRQGVETIWKPDRKDFSPRVGFAWDVTGKGTTVVRGGASIIYSSFVGATFMSQSGLSDAATSVAAVPTGACTVPVVIGVGCPPGQTFGGTIQLASVTIPGSKLNWNGVVFPPGVGLACTADAPCDVAGVDPNLKTPYIVNYEFGVQHSFTTNFSLEVGYVGNHGDNLLGIRDLNQCAPNPDGNCVRPFAAQYPYLQYINYASNDSRSNYNSLQATLTKRVSHGLNFTAGYTFGHGLDNGSLNRFGNVPQNSSNPDAEYASSDFDVRHRLTLTAGYAIPGKKGFGQLLEGWKLNFIVNLQSAQPWLATDGGNDFSTGGSGNGDLADRWDFFGNPADFKSSANSIPSCSGFAISNPNTPAAAIDSSGATCSVTSGIYGTSYAPANSATFIGNCVAHAAGTLSTTPTGTTTNDLPIGGCFASGNSVLTPPALGTFGKMGRNIFRDTGFKNVDFSVFKDFKYRDRFGAQFRFEVFNLFNHPTIANPYGASNGYGGGNGLNSSSTFGCGCLTPDIASGNPIVGSGGARDIQLGLKLIF